MTDHMHLRDEAEAFAQHGYTLVRGLFSAEEASFYCDQAGERAIALIGTIVESYRTGE
jgi:hypothetical protein